MKTNLHHYRLAGVIGGLLLSAGQFWGPACLLQVVALLPLMMLVMATVGVPPEGIAIILGVDRILDMSRTTLNVCGDISASVYVDRVDRDMEGLPPAKPELIRDAG